MVNMTIDLGRGLVLRNPVSIHAKVIPIHAWQRPLREC